MPHAALAQALEETRARTLSLVSGMDEDRCREPAAPYLSPPVWDLGHIANFQEQWLLQRLEGLPEMRAGDNDTYDALAHPRTERPSLRLLDLEGAKAYLAAVQLEVLRRLPGIDMSTAAPRLARDGFAHWMLVLHEHQHQETLIQTFAMQGDAYRPPEVRHLPAPLGLEKRWCDVPGGPVAIGREHGPGAYDNEAQPHTVDVPAFQVASHPVTNGEYLEFLEAGGYEDPSLWSRRGRRWLDETAHHAPLHWDDQGGWHRRTPRDGRQPLSKRSDEILCHVTFFEAEAYARFRDARLPTEAEWEAAAAGAPAADHVNANIDHLGWGPSRAGAYPGGRTACGAQHMLGDVWEWCDSGFEAYPGFEPYPYEGYSKVFFGGDFKVLRGGSWATRAPCATRTFRNWDHPYRRQVFAGVRLARDA